MKVKTVLGMVVGMVVGAVVMFMVMHTAAVEAACTDEPCDTPPCCNGDANGDGAIDISDAVYILNYLFLGGREPVAIECPPNRLPATGNTECFDTWGNAIDCDNEEWPGQDGFHQAGCPMEGRFVNHGDGTVTDNCTGLMWRETPAPGTYTWQEALQYCDHLEWEGDKVYKDWRLPNWRELHSLSTRHGSPFEPGVYWTSTTWLGDRNGALTTKFNVNVISTGGDSKTASKRVRAVRTIQPGK